MRSNTLSFDLNHKNGYAKYFENKKPQIKTFLSMNNVRYWYFVTKIGLTNCEKIALVIEKNI